MIAHNSAPVDLDRLITHIDTRGWPRPAAARAAKGMLDAEKRGDRRFCPLAVPFRPQGRADQGPARRSGGAGGRGADRADRRCGRGHRGRDRRLRVPRGRAGHEHGAADRAARRICRSPSAGTTVNRFCGSSMQAIHMAAGAIQLDAGEVFVCAGVESMTRVQIGGFNFAAEPAPRGGVSAGLHEHGRDRGERGQAVPDHPGRSGGVRRPRATRKAAAAPGRGQASPTRSCRSGATARWSSRTAASAPAPARRRWRA